MRYRKRYQVSDSVRNTGSDDGSDSVSHHGSDTVGDTEIENVSDTVSDRGSVFVSEYDKRY